MEPEMEMEPEVSADAVAPEAAAPEAAALDAPEALDVPRDVPQDAPAEGEAEAVQPNASLEEPEPEMETAVAEEVERVYIKREEGPEEAEDAGQGEPMQETLEGAAERELVDPVVPPKEEPLPGDAPQARNKASAVLKITTFAFPASPPPPLGRKPAHFSVQAAGGGPEAERDNADALLLDDEGAGDEGGEGNASLMEAETEEATFVVEGGAGSNALVGEASHPVPGLPGWTVEDLDTGEATGPPAESDPEVGPELLAIENSRLREELQATALALSYKEEAIVAKDAHITGLTEDNLRLAREVEALAAGSGDAADLASEIEQLHTVLAAGNEKDARSALVIESLRAELAAVAGSSRDYAAAAEENAVLRDSFADRSEELERAKRMISAMDARLKETESRTSNLVQVCAACSETRLERDQRIARVEADAMMREAMLRAELDAWHKKAESLGQAAHQAQGEASQYRSALDDAKSKMDLLNQKLFLGRQTLLALKGTFDMPEPSLAQQGGIIRQPSNAAAQRAVPRASREPRAAPVQARPPEGLPGLSPPVKLPQIPGKKTARMAASVSLESPLGPGPQYDSLAASHISGYQQQQQQQQQQQHPPQQQYMQQQQQQYGQQPQQWHPHLQGSGHPQQQQMHAPYPPHHQQHQQTGYGTGAETGTQGGISKAGSVVSGRGPSARGQMSRRPSIGWDPAQPRFMTEDPVARAMNTHQILKWGN